jgi:peptide/nickel transport system substrate-binding protein
LACVSRSRFCIALLVSAALALLTLGSASGRYGGTLVVGLSSGAPTTLDPALNGGSSAVEIDLATCQRLYDIVSNHGRIERVPELAAGLPVPSKDKLSYTIRLRQGILFNDGTPLNAQAVVASIQRLMNLPGSARASDYESVASVSAAGQYTVVFHMKAPDSTLVGNYMFVFSPTALAREGANFASDPICVGPFMFDHQSGDGSLTYIKSPYYWNKGAIHLDKIVYESATNGPAAAAALEAGDIQAIDNVSTTVLSSVQENAALRTMSGAGLGWNGIVFNIGDSHGGPLNLPYTNTGTPIASSPLLRQAFEEAIDRTTMNRVVFGGLELPSCTPIPPANTEWFNAIKVPCTPFDPAGARKLVGRSGIVNPTVTLLTGSSPDSLRLAQFIQAEEAAVGINVALTQTGSSLTGQFDAELGGYEPGADGEPNLIISQFFASWGVRNYGGYTSKRLDYVLANGLKATQFADRAVNYRVAQQILLTDRPTIFLYDTIFHAAYSASLSGVALKANGLLDVSNAQFR